jgi:hypothetical protein
MTIDTPLIPLDAQFAELIETVWACERQWRLDDHIDAAIRYGGSGAKAPHPPRRCRRWPTG